MAHLLVIPRWNVNGATLSFSANLLGAASQIYLYLVYSSQTNLFDVMVGSVSLKKRRGTEVLDK